VPPPRGWDPWLASRFRSLWPAEDLHLLESRHGRRTSGPGRPDWWFVVIGGPAALLGRGSNWYQLGFLRSSKVQTRTDQLRAVAIPGRSSLRSWMIARRQSLESGKEHPRPVV
jgi:hypothetical protein